MKLLVLKFLDGDDLSAFPWGTEVTVTHDTVVVTGKVFTLVGPMEDPPTLEGDFHIEPIEPTTTPPVLPV
ncbi:unnamed protein product [marine sediment metagenome]|uniref:Uncharacterized protein n=1 Tax=marine sediment metagenome TaxID=412755 RepID=X1GYF7_9ZZZZ